MRSLNSTARKRRDGTRVTNKRSDIIKGLKPGLTGSVCEVGGKQQVMEGESALL